MKTLFIDSLYCLWEKKVITVWHVLKIIKPRRTARVDERYIVRFIGLVTSPATTTSTGQR